MFSLCPRGFPQGFPLSFNQTKTYLEGDCFEEACEYMCAWSDVLVSHQRIIHISLSVFPEQAADQESKIFLKTVQCHWAPTGVRATLEADG